MRHSISAVLLILIAAPALATETECPLEDPENPGHRLVGTFHRVAGCDCGESAEETKRGDHWRTTDWLEKWQERNGELICNYRGPQGGGRDIVLKIPGLLIRCDALGYDVLKPQPVEPGTGGPIETRFLRVWCTSRP